MKANLNSGKFVNLFYIYFKPFVSTLKRVLFSVQIVQQQYICDEKAVDKSIFINYFSTLEQ
jgi:hypothetical protein